MLWVKINTKILSNFKCITNTVGLSNFIYYLRDTWQIYYCGSFVIGEHAEWTKQQLFNIANRVPFMVKVPGVTDNGLKTDNLVELVDLMPTLVEAAGFHPLKTCPESSHHVQLCTEGASLMPLMSLKERFQRRDVSMYY